MSVDRLTWSRTRREQQGQQRDADQGQQAAGQLAARRQPRPPAPAHQRDRRHDLVAFLTQAVLADDVHVDGRRPRAARR